MDCGNAPPFEIQIPPTAAPANTGGICSYRTGGEIVPLDRPLEPFADRRLGRGPKLAHRLPDRFGAILQS
jgi:hypothetical protein